MVDIIRETRVIGSQREPMIDDWLVDKMRGVALRLHQPMPRNFALRFNKPRFAGRPIRLRFVMQDADLYAVLVGAD